MWRQANSLSLLPGFLQVSSSFDVKDETGKVCIIANLTAAFTVEYKSNGQKQVMGGARCLSLTRIYKIWGVFAPLQNWNKCWTNT